MGENPIDREFESLFVTVDSARQVLERTWYRNILYYLGEQWITWLPSAATFVRKHRYNRKIPTPVSNIIRDYVTSIVAMVSNKDYKIDIWPNSNDFEDRVASRIGSQVLRNLDERDDNEFKDLIEIVAMWIAIAGNGFLRDYPSMDHGVVSAGTKSKTGDVRCEMILPFNVFVDSIPSHNLRGFKRVGIQSLKDREWVAENFPEFKYDRGHDDTNAVNYQKSLMHLVSQVSPWKQSSLEAVNLGSPAAENDDLVLFREIEYRPTKKFPNGRYVVQCCGQTIVENDRLPIKTDESAGSWYYTLEDFHFHRAPGRFWSDAGVNDLISPQNTINRIDQALEMNRKGIGRPIVITPADMELKKLTKEGSSFLALQFDARASGGVAPAITHGKPLQQQVLEERAIQKGVAQDAGGDPKGVLRGNSPTSKASGIMVDILRETAEQGHAPMVNRFYRGIRRSYRKKILIVQEVWSEKRLIKIIGHGGNVVVRSFSNTDLRGNTDVRLEMVSGLSTTNAGKTQTITNLLGAGLFQQNVIAPGERRELLKMLNLSMFSEQISPDEARAELEHSQLMNDSLEIFIEAPLAEMLAPEDLDKLEEPYEIADDEGKQSITQDLSAFIVVTDDPLFEFDDHNIHFDLHRRFIISPTFRDLDPSKQTLMIQHIEAHKRRIEAAQQAQMQAQIGMKEAEARAEAAGENPPMDPDLEEQLDEGGE